MEKGGAVEAPLDRGDMLMRARQATRGRAQPALLPMPICRPMKRAAHAEV